MSPKSFVLLAAKHLAAVLLHRTGLLLAFRRRLAPSSPLILMYHRVLPPARGNGFSEPGIVVSTPSFDRQIGMIKRLFDVRPLADLLSHRGSSEAGKETPAGAAPACALTFDDGWSDNYHEALPVLRRHGVVATVYLATAFIGTGRVFWPERVLRAFHGDGRRRIPKARPEAIAEPLWTRLRAAAECPPGRLEDRLDDLIRALKDAAEGERDACLAALETWTGDPRADLSGMMLDWDQAAEMRDAGWEIGSHTMNHVLLTHVPAEEAAREIRGSREAIEKALGREVRGFAYPNGNWSPTLAETVRGAGYAYAVSTLSPYDSTAQGRAAGPYSLARKNMAEGSSRGLFGFSESVFACEVLGVFERAKRVLAGRA